MKLSTSVNVKKEPFHLNHYKSDRQQHWEVHHAHQSMEFLYVYEGRGTVEVHKQQSPVQPGTLLVFQPFQQHRIRMQGTFIRTVLMFDPYLLDNGLHAFGSLRKLFGTLWKGPLAMQAIPGQHELAPLFEKLNRKLKDVHPGKHQEEFTLCLLFLLKHLEPYEKEWIAPHSEHKFKPRYSHTVEQMIEWIELHFKEKFDLHQMSDDLHLSTYYLSHTFRQSTGSSITEFITNRRLKEACLLLETTSKTSGYIAQEVGFLNGSYFCRVFKTMLGLTPKSYRSQLLSGQQ
ncbi:AraC family transcriptional regulator [Paenibacillus aestuarii]|uniref:AraC family transcriptional regulator n=1 Tax=Paenibacillus aestuarii TaxID=516965 RepID=A0ABW0KBB9_9BACL|nr:AraC family transcriptional regulator [Paenibacillus aestuarii]